MIKRFGFSGIAALALLAATSARADVQPGFYAGVGIGEATIEIDDAGFDASDTALKIFGGYAFNDNFAVEVAYFDGGKPDERFGTGTTEVEMTGFNASAVGRLPLNETFALFAKLGFASYDVEYTGRVGGSVVASADDSDSDISYGVGGALNFTRFELRAEYEAVDVSGGNFNVLSLNGLLRF